LKPNKEAAAVFQKSQKDMFNKIARYKLWISAGIIFILGIIFLGGMLRIIGIKRLKTHKNSLQYKARHLYLDGNYIKAANLYEKLLVLRPKSKDAVLDLAIICDDYLNRKERAVELYKRYLNLMPEAEKNKLVKQWMRQAAQAALGIKSIGNETYRTKISQMKDKLDKLKKDKIALKEQVEKLSGKLYTIQSGYEEKIQDLHIQNRRLASQVSSARIQISTLYKALKNAEEEKQNLNGQP